MTERNHRARGQRRREALLRAALEVIGQRGVHHTTHRAVAAAAGVPLATTTYYFASIEELLEAALELFVDEEIRRLQDVGDRVTAMQGSRETVVRAMAAELVEVRTPAVFELYIEASRRAALRDAVNRTLEAYRSLAEDLLRHVGARDPDRAARLTVALLDGLALQHLAVPDPEREERIVDGLLALLAAFVDGDPAVPTTA